jgi:hypothetical protein
MTKLCPRGKAAAKRKFAVYPSAYANAYASKICAGKIKDPSGTKRKDFKGPKPAGKVVGGVISTVGKVLGKKGVKYLKSPEGRKKTKEIMNSPLSKKMKEKLEKLKSTFGKRAGGMTAGSMSGMGRLQKARMMNKGGMNETIDKAKQFKKKSKQRKPRKGFERKYPGPARPGNPVVVYEVKKGGLTSELNNPAKGYTAGGMADYYKDLM